MASILKTWMNGVNEAFMPTVKDQSATEKRHTFHDSTLELKAGLDVEEFDTVPAELLEIFNDRS